MDKQMDQFLDEAVEQISYKGIRPSIRRELEAHIQDRAEEYEGQGMDPEEAVKKAVHDMGDAVVVGTELNEVHQLQKAPGLALVSALLLAIGFAFALYLQFLPEQQSGRVLYYLIGAAVLALTAWKGYPLFVRHAKMGVMLVVLGYLMQITMLLAAHHRNFMAGSASYTYIATLLYAPVVTFLLYRFRKNSRKLLAVLFGFVGVWFYLIQNCHLYNIETAETICLLSIFATGCFMIHREILTGAKHRLYLVAAGIFLVIAGIIIYHPPGYSRRTFDTFLSPESNVTSTWDDSYNGILIQELLRRTPLMSGIELTPDEMMDYGTGAWYFASRDPKQIGIDMTSMTSEEYLEQKAYINEIRKQGGRPQYIYYTRDTVTQWDILPQHYHNNYLIAVCILMFGWLPGIAFVGVILMFYLFLFSCIRKIYGELAATLAFCCGQCLLWQTIFYVLGNFGYQYCTFPNLPLVSEGRFSIIFNLILLGMIYSAYRYDHVVECWEETYNESVKEVLPK